MYTSTRRRLQNKESSGAAPWCLLKSFTAPLLRRRHRIWHGLCRRCRRRHVHGPVAGAPRQNPGRPVPPQLPSSDRRTSRAAAADPSGGDAVAALRRVRGHHAPLDARLARLVGAVADHQALDLEQVGARLAPGVVVVVVVVVEVMRATDTATANFTCSAGIADAAAARRRHVGSDRSHQGKVASPPHRTWEGELGSSFLLLPCRHLPPDGRHFRRPKIEAWRETGGHQAMTVAIPRESEGGLVHPQLSVPVDPGRRRRLCGVGSYFLGRAAVVHAHRPLPGARAHEHADLDAALFVAGGAAPSTEPAPEERRLAVGAGRRRARGEARRRRARRRRLSHYHGLRCWPRSGRLHQRLLHLHRSRGEGDTKTFLAVVPVVVHCASEVALGGEHVKLAVSVRAPPARHGMRRQRPRRRAANVGVPAHVKVRRQGAAVPAPPADGVVEADHLAATISRSPHLHGAVQVQPTHTSTYKDEENGVAKGDVVNRRTYIDITVHITKIKMKIKIIWTHEFHQLFMYENYYYYYHNNSIQRRNKPNCQFCLHDGITATATGRR